jgi:GT2 family glycosyltransferase
MVDWDNALTPQRGVDAVDTGQYNIFQETEFITGCLIQFDRDVLNRAGNWDESYFLYFEDSDFCERAKKNGIKLYYDPNIVIWHKISQSTGGSGSKLHAKYQSKNRVKWGLKYAPWRTKAHLVLNYFSGRG